MCQNQGQCVNIGHTSRCDSENGYHGSLCEKQDDCYPTNNCTNGATCFDGNEEYTLAVAHHLGLDFTVSVSHDCIQFIFKWTVRVIPLYPDTSINTVSFEVSHSGMRL